MRGRKAADVIKPPKVKVIQTRRAVYGCPDSCCVLCEETNKTPVKNSVRTASAPRKNDRHTWTCGFYSPRNTAIICHTTGSRVSSIDIHIPPTMCQWIIQLYEKFKIFAELFRKEILSGPLIGIDETTMQVIMELN
jgi:hypothetical protein